jgi:hypothetical protein
MKIKVIRDPLYNYVAIDLDRHRWLLDLLDTPEVQRLRRIHQLGVSYLTYPGADHSRLAHCLGVMHLMGLAFQYLDREYRDEQISQARAPLLAAALLHDVGHGPFSHVFEPCLGIDHEKWSIKTILDEDTGVNRVLRKIHKSLPQTVAELIDPENNDHPPWQKYLLSSQIDMDRLDYLMRDSLFSGAGCGHFDWYRILTSFELQDGGSGGRDLIWPERVKYAIEEYVFARFYMYQNVYLHKTTRGFERILESLWSRAREMLRNGDRINVLPSIKKLWSTDDATVEQYQRIEEFTVLQQVEEWRSSKDATLAELARRFLRRDRLIMLSAPDGIMEVPGSAAKLERKLRAIVRKKGYANPASFCLRDELKSKYRHPYIPEREADEQSSKNSIRLREASGSLIEISDLLPRLKPLTTEQAPQYRYYVPREAQAEALKLIANWK